MSNIILIGNPVSTWFEVYKLGLLFPNLESLVLAECPIKSFMTSPLLSPNSNIGVFPYPNQRNDEFCGELTNKSYNNLL